MDVAFLLRRQDVVAYGLLYVGGEGSRPLGGEHLGSEAGLSSKGRELGRIRRRTRCNGGEHIRVPLPRLLLEALELLPLAFRLPPVGNLLGAGPRARLAAVGADESGRILWLLYLLPAVRAGLTRSEQSHTVSQLLLAQSVTPRPRIIAIDERSTRVARTVFTLPGRSDPVAQPVPDLPCRSVRARYGGHARSAGQAASRSPPSS